MTGPASARQEPLQPPPEGLHGAIRAELNRRLRQGQEASIEEIVRWVMEQEQADRKHSRPVPVVDDIGLGGVSQSALDRFQRALDQHPRHRQLEEHLTLEQLAERSPWWLLSVAFHLLLGALLALYVVMVPMEEMRRFYTVNIWQALDEASVDPGVQEEEPTESEEVEPEPGPEPEPVDEEVTAVEPEPEPEPVKIEAEPEVAPPTEATQALQDRRSNEARERALRMYGGSAATEAAVREGLAWLARHQAEDGSWSPETFNAACPDRSCWGLGNTEITEGLTGLATLAFLGSGITHRGRQEHSSVVERSLAHLRRLQHRGTGLIGPETGDSGWIYEHAIGTLALSEAFGLTGDEALREPVARAVQFLIEAQQEAGGWDYTHYQTGRNDVSVSGWVVMALRSAQLAGLEVPAETLQRARSLLRANTRANGEVIYANEEPGTDRRGIGMVAVGLLSRLYLGEPTSSPVLRRMGRRVASDAPSYDRLHADQFHTMYYWYYGTLAMFQMGGTHWKHWNESLQDALLPHQVRHGHARGSWDPEDPWLGPYCGRVYSTALNVLNLEIYYRYLPIYGSSGGEGLLPGDSWDADPEEEVADPTPPGRRSTDDLDVEQALTLIDSTDSQARARAVRVLINSATQPEAREGLVRLLEDPLSTIRWQAVTGLREAGSRKAVPHLIRRLREEEVFLQRVIADTLGELGDPAAIDALGELLDSGDSSLRTRAMQALGRITGEPIGKDPRAWRRWIEERPRGE